MSITTYIFIVLIFIATCLVIALPIVFGAPYLPTPQKVVDTIVKLSDIKSGERVADLGSGDGRIVIAFAKKGIEAHGYEINPLLVVISKIRIARAGVRDKAHIHWSNFWMNNVSQFDVVILFGKQSMMKQLAKKLQKELQKGSRIFSYAFHFPNLPPVTEDKKNGVYKYVV